MTLLLFRGAWLVAVSAGLLWHLVLSIQDRWGAGPLSARPAAVPSTSPRGVSLLLILVAVLSFLVLLLVVSLEPFTSAPESSFPATGSQAQVFSEVLPAGSPASPRAP